MTPPIIRRLCLPWLAALLPAAVQAQNSPYYFGGSFGLTSVSNVFRAADGSNSDRVTTASLLAGLDQRLGRQRLSADASVQANRYSTNRDLDNQSYSLRSALDWQTVADLSGTVSASSSRSLAEFNIGGGVEAIRKKNLERNEEYAGVARLGVLSRYTLEAGYTHRDRSYSAVEYDRFVFHQNTGSFGAYAQPGANLRLGVVARRSLGRYPRYPVAVPGGLRSEANDFGRTDIDLTATWDTGASSKLNARVSRSRLKNSLSGVRDFSGSTGALSWNWQATAKLALGAGISRDTGLETQASRLGDLNRVYQNYQLSANYAVTSKVSLAAATSYFRSTARSGDGTFADGYDNSRNHSLNARWAYSRAITLSCQYSRASRASNTAAYVYASNSLGCAAQALIL